MRMAGCVDARVSLVEVRMDLKTRRICGQVGSAPHGFPILIQEDEIRNLDESVMETKPVSGTQISYPFHNKS